MQGGWGAQHRSDIQFGEIRLRFRFTDGQRWPHVHWCRRRRERFKEILQKRFAVGRDTARQEKRLIAEMLFSEK